MAKTSKSQEMPKIRPFLKWLGGKYRLCDKIKAYLPDANTYIEPFLGAGALYLNTDYPNAILNDINPHLIDLYQNLQYHGQTFIDDAKAYFTGRQNSEKSYYKLREKFNTSKDKFERSLIFLYLNRHGYNGLCRFNASGGFNVPFGRYENPYFPEVEMLAFYHKAQKAHFYCEDFQTSLKRAKKGMVVYCDPPYAPLSKTAYFTGYSKNGFSHTQHLELATIAHQLSQKGVNVVISNHDTPYTRDLYHKAKLTTLKVHRSVSCKKRGSVKEIMAHFEP